MRVWFYGNWEWEFPKPRLVLVSLQNHFHHIDCLIFPNIFYTRYTSDLQTILSKMDWALHEYLKKPPFRLYPQRYERFQHNFMVLVTTISWTWCSFKTSQFLYIYKNRYFSYEPFIKAVIRFGLRTFKMFIWGGVNCRKRKIYISTNWL